MLVFLWWAWAWLSALVNIFHELWFEDIIVVDKYQSQITDKLQAKWIKVVIWDGIYDFQKDDIIFYSDAVINSQDFQKVQENIKFTYFQFLWEISKWFQTIAIAGTHGKTSTTAMILTVAKNIWFEKLWLWIVGGFVPDLNNNNFFVNQNKKEDIKLIFEKLLTAKWNRPTELFKEMYFIVEADEFNKHFLLLDPSITLITKVDHDHKDVYPTQESYFETFEEFILKTKKEIFTNDKELTQNIWEINKKIEFIWINKKLKFNYMFWEHMLKNASLAIKLFEILGFNEQKIIEILNNFKWIWRRQEYLGKLKNIEIYTDYAHHPTEIEATASAFKNNFPNKKIIWIFQPHQLFRFVSYEKDFLKSLEMFDKVFIYDIYSVREDDLIQKLIKDRNLDVKTNQQAIKKIWEQIANKLKWKYIDNFENLIENIKGLEWITVIMTAWDLDYKIRNYLKFLYTSK